MDDFELELKKDFLDEADALLDECEEAFLELESTGPSTEIWDLIFRLAHNFKGTSRAVGFSEIAEFTHELESLILKLKNNEIQTNSNIVSLLLESNDQLKIMIKELKSNINATFDQKDIIQKIKEVTDGVLVDAPEITPLGEALEGHFDQTESIELPAENNQDVTFQDGDGAYTMDDIEKMLALNNKNIKQEEETNAIDSDSGSAQVIPLNTESYAPKKTTPPQASPQASLEDESIRVPISRVEMLNNYVGELVILQSVLLEYRDCKNPGDSQKLKKELNHLGKICKEIQSISMRMRMIPLKNTFSKLNRIVRDTSRVLNKKINLHIDGEETEVDKTILEQLSDPLVHIIRNAADHGIEDSETRIQNGKTPEGNVYIDAYHEGSHLVIEVGDDGAGIYPDIIREKALERGIINASDRLTNQELCELIFHPGFSTKDEVSEISGRGVGMDVVRTNIRKIGGEVNLKSEPNKGSIFKLSLPLTVAIIEGLVVGVASEKLVVPLTQIHETLQINDSNLKFISNMGYQLILRDEVLPAFKLKDILKIKTHTELSQPEIALVIRHEKISFAVIVDDIFRQQQVVIKKLGEEYKAQKGFVGSSILGDGRPALIIDTIELLTHKIMKHNNSQLQKVA